MYHGQNDVAEKQCFFFVTKGKLNSSSSYHNTTIAANSAASEKENALFMLRWAHLKLEICWFLFFCQSGNSRHLVIIISASSCVCHLDLEVLFIHHFSSSKPNIRVCLVFCVYDVFALLILCCFVFETHQNFCFKKGSYVSECERRHYTCVGEEKTNARDALFPFPPLWSVRPVWLHAVFVDVFTGTILPFVCGLGVLQFNSRVEGVYV